MHLPAWASGLVYYDARQSIATRHHSSVHPAKSATPATMATTTSFATNKTTYQQALRSFFSGRPDDTLSDLSALLTPTFTLRAERETLDFLGFVEHIRTLRAMKGLVVELDVVQFVCDGRQVGERHVSTTTHDDGTASKAETFQFVEIAPDGRLESIVETVRPR